MATDVSDSGGGHSIAGRSSSNLRNEDFRQLLSRRVSQPAPVTSNTSAATISQGQSSHSFSHRQTNESKRGQNTIVKVKKSKEVANNEEEDQLGPSNLNEILKNYRDRAEERRKGDEKDVLDDLNAANAYKAVPSDIRASADAAQRRKQAIQESKYLGGDMEHTHLVKGLDYSLLHKVRSEIALREQKSEDIYESKLTKSNMEDIQTDNHMVRNIHRIIFQNEVSERNELFRKGRMAYVIDLEEEETDLPTTLIRSIHDCPAAESSSDISTGNLLIQKLTQVLSYLRTDSLRKKKRFDVLPEERSKLASQPIFDMHAPSKHSDRDKESNRDKERDRRRHKPSSYFDDHGGREDRDRQRDRVRHREADRSTLKDREKVKQRLRDDEKRENGKQQHRANESSAAYNENLFALAKKKKSVIETEGYDECYPGGFEFCDGAGESDDEADYSKMDMGNRRGPIKRWDFDDADQYEKYMESKEAMPKAAYQFGVKTNDGRRTRKTANDKEKVKLDREYSQITKILEKRKSGGQKYDTAKRLKY